MSDNEWQGVRTNDKEWERMTRGWQRKEWQPGTTYDNEWQRITASNTMSDSEWQWVGQQIKTNQNELEQAKVIDFRFQNETKDQTSSWRTLFNFLYKK